MTDLAGARILEVVEGADKEAVIKLWEQLPEEQRGKVEAVAMDRGAAMVSGTQAAAPKAVIVHDKFHISQDQNKAVDDVRRRVQWVSGAPGGRGAVRELIEVVLRAQGRWETLLASYMDDRPPVAGTRPNKP